MWSLVSLVLPVLVPSWRFFKTVEPSPRVEWAPVGGPPWQELLPRPDRLGPTGMLARLFWNPIGNERLFMVSCAERLMQSESAHSAAQIQARVRRAAQAVEGPNDRAAQFRIVFVHRSQQGLQRDVLYTSHPFALAATS
jgi:hypothetical protein